MEKAQKSFKLKNALYLLLVLPLLFLFTACGGDAATAQLRTEASCDTSGEYATEASQAEYEEIIGEQTDFASNAYRMTAKMSLTMPKTDEEQKPIYDEQGNVVTEEVEFTTINMIIKENQTDPTAVTYEAAIKVRMSNIFKSVLDDKDLPDYYEMYMYFKDGKMYSEDEDGNKTYQEMDFYEIFYAEEMEMMSFICLEDILDVVDYADTVTVTKQDNNFKLVADDAMVIYGQEIDAGAVVYVNFNNEGDVVAAQVEFSMSFFGMATMNSTFTVSEFNGDIAFPDFSKYVEATDTNDDALDDYSDFFD